MQPTSQFSASTTQRYRLLEIYRYSTPRPHCGAKASVNLHVLRLVFRCQLSYVQLEINPPPQNPVFFPRVNDGINLTVKLFIVSILLVADHDA